MAYKLSPSDVLDIANAGLNVKDINKNDITKAGIAATNILAAISGIGGRAIDAKNASDYARRIKL